MEVKTIVEALLFASEKPMTPRALLNAFKKAALAAPETEAETIANNLTEDDLRAVLLAIQDDYAASPRPMQLQELEGAYRLVTKAEVGLWVRQLFDQVRPARLTPPALETLAIIAYRQPVSRADLEGVRGVSVDGVMASLLERKLVKIAGRADTPGRPLLYQTTSEFLEHFGLKNLRELPNLEELRRMETKVTEPAASIPGQPARDALTDTPSEPAEAILPTTIPETLPLEGLSESSAPTEETALPELTPEPAESASALTPDKNENAPHPPRPD